MLVVHTKKLIKFSIIGASGALINLLIFYIFAIIFNYGHNISAILAFSCAVSSNFLLNSIWTFARYSKDKRPELKKYIKYFLGNIVGLGINLTALNALISNYSSVSILAAQIFGIICAMFFNFIFANYLIFK